MKKPLSLYYTTFITFCLVCTSALLSLTSNQDTYADVNNFHFSNFTGDYYLEKDPSGISHLKVKESVTAVFPDFNQNKGICRQIPFTNQDGANVTLSNLTKSTIIVTRNGTPEPIYSIDKEGNYYNVCTGTDEYILGEQTYTFEYTFDKVVTDFKNYQELYWDTNGNGATQRFNQVTARLHFTDPNDWTGKSWCYVGKYGSNNQDRCTITKISDGVEFSATNLTSHENLTFDVELKPFSFTVPEPENNYIYIWLIIGLGTLCTTWLIYRLYKFIKSLDKARQYKGIFVKPEYQPNSYYSLPEMTEIYLGKKKDMKVAMLLELVIQKKIAFQKLTKRKWAILIKNLDQVGEEYLDLLAILNNGTRPAVDDTIELKSHSASNRLITLKKSLETKILGDLKKDQLVENKYQIGDSGNHGWGSILTTVITYAIIIMIIGATFINIVGDQLDFTTGRLIFEEAFFPTAITIVVVTIIISAILSDFTSRYQKHTLKGLEASKYMDGLKLYIEMAEADRMKMLQSVKGVDTSAEGIVKLYEKLLPYAAVFGLEESWMKEMQEYCKVKEIEEPDYLLAGITAHELAHITHNASNYVSTATTMRSSGGGSSSGFSGGGGGGFSGGGGGGGGFGGR